MKILLWTILKTSSIGGGYVPYDRYLAAITAISDDLATLKTNLGRVERMVYSKKAGDDGDKVAPAIPAAPAQGDWTTLRAGDPPPLGMFE